MNGICGLGTGYTNQKVVGLDVAIDEGLLVNGLHTGHLYRDHSNVSNLNYTKLPITPTRPESGPAHTAMKYSLGYCMSAMAA